MADTARHNEAQIEYFTNRPVPRMTVDRVATPYVRRQVERVIAAAALQPGERVLDVGCGPGKYTLALAAAGLDVEGLDLTPKLVDDLRAVAPQLRVHVGDILDPPEQLRGFDAVAGFFVLHHLIDLPAAMRGVASMLRPGGRAVFCEPNAWFLGYYAQIAVTRGMTFKGERGIPQMRMSVIEPAARAAGFASCRVERFGAVPPALANRAWGQKVEGAIERIPKWDAVAAFQVFTLQLPC